MIPIAHTKQNPAIAGNWEDHALEDHLLGVAALAERFAKVFEGRAYAELAGRWHDLGKYRPRFQSYIRRVNGRDADAHIEGGAGRVTHSTAGALRAIEHLSRDGRGLAYLIAGHHAGLDNWHGDEHRGGLDARLNSQDGRDELAEAMAATPSGQVLRVPALAPMRDSIPGFGQPLSAALWLRMLFSCLVDADFLDTETFMNPGQAGLRERWASLEVIQQRLNTQLSKFEPRTPLDHYRAQVLADCRSSAHEAQGLFTLTVPTGGGKTLSSLAFGIEHAIKHGLRRVIYAIPYTSIIEQTANVFREALGDDAVLEHHSNLDVDDPARENARSRLASENWDAPVVVTTNVQLFESLFARRTSRCRKLHNIAGSVVILDEAQLLPRDFLDPICQTLRLLAAYYRTSAVLCTATQPALTEKRDNFGRMVRRGVGPTKEIIHSAECPESVAKRVQFHLPDITAQRREWPDIAAEISQHEAVLAIVNTKRDARELFARLPPEGRMHLSTWMCGAHRADVLQRIRKALQATQEGRHAGPLRVVSTQLIEAGVDVDFSVVFRALTGLDSIAQAAGRCNREGRIAEGGKVVVFVPPKASPPGALLQAENAMIELLHAKDLDPLAPESFRRYFERLYGGANLDAKGILPLLKCDPEDWAIQFRSASDAFRLIEDETHPVIVPYIPDGQTDSPIHAWVGALRENPLATWARRKLQRYVVGVHDREFAALQKSGAITQDGAFWVAWPSTYHPVIGLILDSGAIDPAALVAG